MRCFSKMVKFNTKYSLHSHRNVIGPIGEDATIEAYQISYYEPKFIEKFLWGGVSFLNFR